jgi:hypothetical protein
MKQRKLAYTIKVFLYLEQFGKALLNSESKEEVFTLDATLFQKCISAKFEEKGFCVSDNDLKFCLDSLIMAGLMLKTNEGVRLSENGKNVFTACFTCENPLDTSSEQFNVQSWQRLILQYYLDAYPKETSQSVLALKTGFSLGVINNVLRLSSNTPKEPIITQPYKTFNPNQHFVTVPDTLKVELDIISQLQGKTPQQYLEASALKQLQLDTDTFRKAAIKHIKEIN